MRTALKNKMATRAKRSLPFKYETSVKLIGDDVIAPLKINETKEAYMLCIYKPGLKAASVSTSVTGKILMINAEPVRSVAGTSEGTHQPKYFKCLSLPGYVNERNIRVRYRAGILKVQVYKAEELV